MVSADSYNINFVSDLQSLVRPVDESDEDDGNQVIPSSQAVGEVASDQNIAPAQVPPPVEEEQAPEGENGVEGSEGEDLAANQEAEEESDEEEDLDLSVSMV